MKEFFMIAIKATVLMTLILLFGFALVFFKGVAEAFGIDGFMVGYFVGAMYSAVVFNTHRIK